MDREKYDKSLMDFLTAGQGFFQWFQGKNTPNILSNMSEQLGALEVALKNSTRRPPVTEFAYLSAEKLDELWAKVQRHLSEGWQPHETLVVGVVDGETRYFQAVVKF